MCAGEDTEWHLGEDQGSDEDGGDGGDGGPKT